MANIKDIPEEVLKELYDLAYLDGWYDASREYNIVKGYSRVIEDIQKFERKHHLVKLMNLE